MGQVILEKKKQGVNFALCESCYWTASLLDIAMCNFSSCPLCSAKNLALMPIAANEKYHYNLSTTGSLELHFSLREDAPKKLVSTAELLSSRETQTQNARALKLFSNIVDLQTCQTLHEYVTASLLSRGTQ